MNQRRYFPALFQLYELPPGRYFPPPSYMDSVPQLIAPTRPFFQRELIIQLEKHGKGCSCSRGSRIMVLPLYYPPSLILIVLFFFRQYDFRRTERFQTLTLRTNAKGDIKGVTSCLVLFKSQRRSSPLTVNVEQMVVVVRAC